MWLWKRIRTSRLGLALLPLIILIAVIIGLSATGMKNVVYIGMLAGIIASIVCFFKYVPSIRDALGKGAVAGVGPAVFTSAAVGVGTVAAASVGFTVIYEAIFNMPGGTYVSAATMAAALGGIMGSGSGAVGIIAQNFLEPVPGHGRRSGGSGEDHRHVGHDRRRAAQLRRHVRHARRHGPEPQELLQAHRRHLHWCRHVRPRGHDHHGERGYLLGSPLKLSCSLRCGHGALAGASSKP